MGIRQTGLPLGGALAAALLPALAAHFDWRVALAVGAAVAGASGLLFGAAYRPGLIAPSRSPIGFRTQVRQLLAARSIRTAMWAGFGMVSAQFAFIAYLMLFLRDVHGVPLTTGAWLLFGAQMAGVVGRVVLAAWSDRLGSRMSPVAISAAVAAVGAVVLVSVGDGTPLAVMVAITVVMGFFAFGWYGPWVVFVAEAAPPDAVGITLALAMTANQLAIVVFPPAFGALLDATNGYTVPWLALAAGLVAMAIRVGKRSAPTRP
jgi:predicted MFS family arabinose efflux permease